MNKYEIENEVQDILSGVREKLDHEFPDMNPEHWQRVRTALWESGHRNPQQLISTGYAEILSMQLELLQRAHRMLQAKCSQADRSHHYEGKLTDEGAADYQAYVLPLHRAFLDTSASFAKIQHVLKLADPKTDASPRQQSRSDGEQPLKEAA